MANVSEVNKNIIRRYYLQVLFFSLIQIGSGAYPASYPMGTRGFIPGSKAAGTWSWPLAFI